MGQLTGLVLVAWAVIGFALAGCSPRAAQTGTPALVLFPTASKVRPVETPTIAAPSSTPRRSGLTPIAPAGKTATPSVLRFANVEGYQVMAAIFPELAFKVMPNEFQVNDSTEWRMWINSRAEGRFTQPNGPQLAVIVANEAPHLTSDQRQRIAPWGSFLAILEERNGKLTLVHKALLFPADISPLALAVRIDGIADFDHDDQDELVIVSEAIRQGTTSTSAYLYQWNVQNFSEYWSAAVGEDNTGAINQKAYYAIAPIIRVADVDGDGIDEIVVDVTRVDYARGEDGLANVSRETARREERRVYRWNGAGFVADGAHSTPMPPLASPTP